MNIENIYYGCLVEIVAKKYILGRFLWDSGYKYTLRPLKNRYVYKSGKYYIDLINKNKYRLFSEMFSFELEVGMLVIDDKNYNLVNITNEIVKYNLQHEDSQIKMKKHMTKRKILKILDGGKK